MARRFLQFTFQLRPAHVRAIRDIRAVMLDAGIDISEAAVARVIIDRGLALDEKGTPGAFSDLINELIRQETIEEVLPQRRSA